VFSTNKRWWRQILLISVCVLDEHRNVKTYDWYSTLAPLGSMRPIGLMVPFRHLIGKGLLFQQTWSIRDVDHSDHFNCWKRYYSFLSISCICFKGSSSWKLYGMDLDDIYLVQINILGWTDYLIYDVNTLPDRIIAAGTRLLLVGNTTIHNG